MAVVYVTTARIYEIQSIRDIVGVVEGIEQELVGAVLTDVEMKINIKKGKPKSLLVKSTTREER